MSDQATAKIGSSVVKVYDTFFVPALFCRWPGHVLRAVGVREGERVLDVACGTGVLSVAAAAAVGAGGTVVGVDINPGMIAAARRKSSSVQWHAAAAEALPFEGGAFDRVVSQFGLMFFSDQAGSIAEMMRVAGATGRVAFAVWAGLDATPGYAEMHRILDDVCGRAAADALAAPFSLGDIADLRSLCADAGTIDVNIETVTEPARFTSIDEWVHTEIKGWILADTMDDASFETLQRESRSRLSQFVRSDGAVEFDAPAHIVTLAERG